MTLTMGRGSQPGPFEIMLRNLLAERFRLVVHSEAREMPVYALVRARRDGKLGLKLQPVSEECAAKVADFIAGRRRPTMDDLPRPGQPVPCGALQTSPNNIESGGATMAQLAAWLSGPRMSGRLVQDRTALTGIYSVSLRWTPNARAVRCPAAGSAVAAWRRSGRCDRPVIVHRASGAARIEAQRYACPARRAGHRSRRTSDGELNCQSPTPDDIQSDDI